MEPGESAGIRLAQLVDATGLSPLVIRAWERRYGFPTAERTSGGHRRYTTSEAAALQRAALLVRSGFRPKEAIRRAQASAGVTPDGPEPELVDLLVSGDAPAAIARLRSLEVTVGFEQVLATAALPAMRSIGELWESGAGGIADEHVATAVVQSWIGLVRSDLPDPHPGASRVLVVSAPGELHDLPALVLETLLARRGLNAVSVGANLPPEAAIAAARERTPAAVVVSCVHHELDTRRLNRLVRDLRAAVPEARLYAGGPGTPPAIGAIRLPLDLLEAAEALATAFQ